MLKWRVIILERVSTATASLKPLHMLRMLCSLKKGPLRGLRPTQSLVYIWCDMNKWWLVSYVYADMKLLHALNVSIYEYIRIWHLWQKVEIKIEFLQKLFEGAQNFSKYTNCFRHVHLLIYFFFYHLLTRLEIIGLQLRPQSKKNNTA